MAKSLPCMRGLLCAGLMAHLLTACEPVAAPVHADPPAASSPVVPAGPASSAPLPVTLPDTIVHEAVSASGRRYPVWVALPADYANSLRRYPVVFVTDGGYAFPLVRSIRNLVVNNDDSLEDFILVGLPPEVGQTSKASRSRDYTPSNPLLGPRSRGSYSAALYGEAAAYRDFIADRVFPLVAREYRADMSRTVLAGHSLGGLFGSYVLLTRPSMFSHYILSSPSLWFHERRIDAIEREYAARHTDLPANVRLYIGRYEQPGDNARYNRTKDMVGDTRAFERMLEARGYPGLRIDHEVLADEDHVTAFPVAVSRGLRWALPGAEPVAAE
jgi:uncharacterized protein